MGRTIKVNCTTTDCIHYNTCCRIPTETYFDEDDGVKIVVVGQGAGWQEEKNERPWIGKAGQLLRDVFKSVMKDKKKVGIALTNTVRCRPSEPVNNSSWKKKDREPTTLEVKTCNKYLIRDLNELKPEIVILAGGSAARAFGYTGTVHSLRGTTDTKQLNGTNFITTVIVTYHPAGVLRKEELGTDLRLDIEMAYNYSIIRGLKLPPPTNEQLTMEL